LRELDFLLIDVFADEAFGGSRLTLFPSGRDLPVAVMHKIAREMSPGETAFVLDRPSRGADRARLRVFTPEVELPVAGHAMLGATFGLDVLGWRESASTVRPFIWSLEGSDVPITTRRTGDDAIYVLAHGEPTFLGQYYHRDRVAAALGLAESEIAVTGLPCEVISTGLPIHVVPVGSLAAVQQAILRRRDADLIARDLGFGDLFVFTCETVDPEASVHCRMFAPHFGIPEDPASGVAMGALAAYLVKHRLIRWSDRLAFLAEQGLEMDRPSRLFVEATVRAGVATDISVGGRCILVGRGKITLP
jgi:trans-2,3-dihydro-3-hydroxyanthranilate isomerase